MSHWTHLRFLEPCFLHDTCDPGEENRKCQSSLSRLPKACCLFRLGRRGCPTIGVRGDVCGDCGEDCWAPTGRSFDLLFFAASKSSKLSFCIIVGKDPSFCIRLRKLVRFCHCTGKLGVVRVILYEMAAFRASFSNVRKTFFWDHVALILDRLKQSLAIWVALSTPGFKVEYIVGIADFTVRRGGGGDYHYLLRIFALHSTVESVTV